MKRIVFLILFLVIVQIGQAQKKITVVKELPHTEAKDQQHAGTCWSFATTSFIESEIMRNGGEELNLSELFFVYHAYMMKVDNFVRMHGKANFSQGGQAHDVMAILDQYGAMPETAFDGYAKGDTLYDHTEMETLLSAMSKFWAGNEKISSHRVEATKAILDTYLGKLPEEFVYNEKKMTANDFKEKIVKLNPNDYIQLTSFSHHQYFKPFRLEIPDNWYGYNYYNVPMNDLIKIIDNAINNGYTVCWDGDVSELGFEHQKGYAILDEDSPKPTQEERQKGFDNFSSTDDHLMHLVGFSKDKNGKDYYIIKNSWGTDTNDYKGLLHMSKDFAALKTIAIMVHKDAIPKSIKSKLGL